MTNLIKNINQYTSVLGVSSCFPQCLTRNSKFVIFPTMVVQPYYSMKTLFETFFVRGVSDEHVID